MVIQVSDAREIEPKLNKKNTLQPFKNQGNVSTFFDNRNGRTIQLPYTRN